MECFRQKQMMLDQSTQAVCSDTADYFSERDKKYGMTEFNVSAVVQPHTAGDATSAVRTTFGELMETIDYVPGKLQIPQGISRPGGSHPRLGSQNSQTHEFIPSHPPAAMAHWSPIQKLLHVARVSFNPCILRPELNTIQTSDSDGDKVTVPALPVEWIGKWALATMYLF